MHSCDNCKKRRDCNKKIGFTNAYGNMHFEDLTYCSQYELDIGENSLIWMRIYSEIANKFEKYLHKIIRTNIELILIVKNDENEISMFDLKNEVNKILKDHETNMLLSVGVIGTEPDSDKIIESVLFDEED